MSRVSRIRDALAVVGEYTANSLYGLRHPAWRKSGATAEEEHRSLPGDELVADPQWSATRAETILAPPEQVWPWIAQLGYGRGGYYGDFPWWRDPEGHRGRSASAHGVLAEHQRLEVGDVVLDGPNCTEQVGAWRVQAVDPGRLLVLFTSRTPLSGREVGYLPRLPRCYFNCSWAFVLEPAESGWTRLLVRSRVRTVPTWAIHAMTVLRLGDTVMQRAMLAGIKRRVEHERTAPRSDQRAARRAENGSAANR